jgi:hypothetical protein
MNEMTLISIHWLESSTNTKKDISFGKDGKLSEVHIHILGWLGIHEVHKMETITEIHVYWHVSGIVLMNHD